MTKARYIVVEGVIGVGKTTLVEALAERLDARTVFEVFEENPFLAQFYRDQRRFAFPTEMFFLLSRFQQQEAFAQEDLFRTHSVSDYLFEKCRIFAGLTLEDAELRLFDRMYEILVRQIPQPDVVVYLHAPVDTLVERIASRGRDYEQTIDPGYLTALDEQYRRFFAHYDAAPRVSIDTTTVDFRRAEPVDRLLAMLDAGATGEIDPLRLTVG